MTQTGVGPRRSAPLASGVDDMAKTDDRPGAAAPAADARAKGRLAKLSPPRLHRPMRRERLMALLDAKRAHPAVWVSGPPGAGKTTLLTSYCPTRDLPILWMQVDPGDADVSTFFYYLTEAARALVPRKRALPLLTPEYLPDLPGFARRYFRALFAMVPAGTLVVLDNCQTLPQDGPVFDVIGVALAEIPEHANLVLVSRSEPPAVLLPHLANANLATIGWTDLRLTPDEATALAAQRSTLNAADVGRLHDRSDGWISGFALMLERASHRDPAGANTGGASPEAIFEYFAAQILEATDERHRHTLLATSLFHDFTADDAVAISGHADAPEVLDDLCRRNLFTYRKSSVGQHYQYHALFREFLEHRLRAQVNASDLEALQRRAAALSETEGRPDNALELYCASADWDAAARVILAAAPTLLAQGRWKTLRDWVGALPAEYVPRHPWLLYGLGSARMQEDRKAARDIFIEAFDGFAASGVAVGQMLCAAAVIRTYHFEYNTFEPMDRWVAEIDRLLETGPQFPTAAAQLAVWSALLLAFTYRLPGHRLRAAAIERVTHLLDADIDANQKVPAGFALILHHTMSHEMARARPVIERIGPLLDAPELTALNRVNWCLFIGYHHHRTGDRSAAEQALDQSDRIAAEHGLRQSEFISHCFRSYHCTSWWDANEGARALDGLGAAVSDATPMLGAQFHNATMFVEMLRGNGPAAERHARLAVAAANRLGAPFFTVSWMSYAAGGLAMNGAFDEAEQWLDTAWAHSDNGFLVTYRPAILATRAWVAMLRGRRDVARDHLRHMFSIGHDLQALAYLRNCPLIKDAVLAEALEARIEVPLARQLIRKFRVPAPPRDIEGWPWPVRVRTLGTFRIEVDDEPLTFGRKTPRKPIALLAALIAFGGRHVPEQKLVDALWTDDEGDSAGEAFAVSLYRLRKLLVHPEVVQFADGLVSLDPAQVWVDTWAFDRAVAEAERSDDEGARRAPDRVRQLYRGPFLPAETASAWSLAMRDRVRGQFLRHVARTGRRHEDAGRLDDAVQLYEQGIEADALAEELYGGLMRTLHRLGRRAEAMAVFRRLRQTLSVTLGIAPSAASEQLFEAIRQDG